MLVFVTASPGIKVIALQSKHRFFLKPLKIPHSYSRREFDQVSEKHKALELVNGALLTGMLI